MMAFQSGGSVARRWQANSDARMDWAFEAYRRLVASLSTDVSSRMVSAHPEAYVVVFGRTQVGKTTLLLELMGVRASSLNRVSTVLRGGRVKGKSATATAMEYGRSGDAFWSLQVPNQPPERFTDDTQVCAALGDLRHRMETQQLHLDRPVRLDIPCDCFEQVPEDHARVRMLDLPGDQASNPVEQQHVEHVAERFVAGADLILLVGKMDDLSFLKPGGLLLPGIEDWQIVPERFRIVTTYSFTAASVQAAVRKHGLKIEQVRLRLVEQLETFGSLSLDARRADLFFPLEFGQSIERTARHDPGLVEQIKPLVDELKADLARQINTSTTPMARLRTALRSHLTVAKVKEQKLDAMDVELKGLHARLKKARAELDAAERAAAASSDRYKNLTCRQEQLDSVNPKSLVSTICTMDESEQTAALKGCEKSVKSLQSCLDGFRTWLRQSYLALDAKSVSTSTEAKWFWSGVLPTLEEDLHAVRRLLDEHLGPIERHLQKYWIDGYWVDSTFEKDVTAVREAMNEAASACRALASRRWCSAIEQQLRAHSESYQAAVSEVSIDELLLRDLKAKLNSTSDAVIRFEGLIRDFEERMAADQDRCLAFTGMLNESYARQLGSMMNSLREGDDPAYVLVDLVSCVQLIETRSQLLATGSPDTPSPPYTH